MGKKGGKKKGAHNTHTNVPQSTPVHNFWDPKMWSANYNATFRAPNAMNQQQKLHTYVFRSTNEFLDNGSIQQRIPSPSTPAGFVDVSIRAPYTTPKNVKTDTIVPVNRPPQFSYTNVRVVNMDCIKATYQLYSMCQGRTSACLNMANQFTRGGGWANGRLAQEESLFYRTNLSRGLCQVNYPLDVYTSVLTRDVTVFRGDYSNGYEFLPECEQFKFNVITAAAFDMYNKATGQSIPFVPEHVSKTRLKIESFFSLCVSEGIDVLVLGAIGCGAFRNPPYVIASLFRSVIEQYAGYFQEVVFCIVDAPNSPKLLDFARTLVNMSVTEVPPTTVLNHSVPCCAYRQNTRLLPSPVPPQVLSKPVCAFAGNCLDCSRAHLDEYIHPPYCPNGCFCKINDDVHRIIYLHSQSQQQHQHQQQQQLMPQQKCHGHLTGLCREPFMCHIALNKKDPNHIDHINKYKHVCRFGNACKDCSSFHKAMFLHMEKRNCCTGRCKDIRNPEHRFAFYHNGQTDFMLHCDYNPCNKINDKTHYMNCYHHNDDFVPSLQDLKKYNIILK